MRCLAVAIAIAAVSPLQAQEVGSGLLRHLDRIPVAALSQFDPLPQIAYGDPRAGARAVATPPDAAMLRLTGPLAGVVRAAIAPTRDWLTEETMAGMAARTGFALTDVQAWSGMNAPPDRLVIVDLDPALLPAVEAALLADGYAATDSHGFAALFRAEDDYAVDFDARDLADPFGGMLGQSSRVAIADGMVLQSPGWPLLSVVMTDPGQSLAARPDIAALVASLDTIPVGDHALVTARLALDPLAFVTYAPIDMAVLDSPVIAPSDAAAPAPGLPPWSSALFADLSDGQSEIAVVALSYDTRDLAKSAAREMARQWSDVPVPSRGATLAALTGAPAAVSVTGEGPFVALAAITTPTAVSNGFMVNSADRLIFELELMRELALVAPLSLP